MRDITDYLSRLRLDVFRQDVTKEMVNIIGVRPTSMLTVDQIQETRNEQESWGGTLQADLLPHTDHYVILGYDVNIDDLDATTDIAQTTTIDPPGPAFSQTTTTSSFDYDANAASHAIYLQDEWTLPADFTLTLGARSDLGQHETDRHEQPDHRHRNPFRLPSRLQRRAGLGRPGQPHPARPLLPGLPLPQPAAALYRHRARRL